MKLKSIITLLFFVLSTVSIAQEAVPTAKTKAQRKAERKQMTLEERIEDTLPVDVSLPSASINAPGKQKITTIEEAKKYVTETVPGYKEKAKEYRQNRKKAKREAKKKTFDGKTYEGLAVEKRIYKRGSGSRMQYIEFYTLKNYQAPSPYLRSIFWLDDRTKRIIEAVSRDKRTNHLLHGPYKEYRGENLVLAGDYYLGAKDGRWETYDRDYTLLDKVSYKKGFLEESEISYYDKAETKIKEVIPFLYGKKTGQYFLFHEGGTLLIEGEYDSGVKIGRWVEYYDSGNRRKSETQYGRDCYDETAPKLLREYSEDGKMTFEDESLKRM